VSDPRLFETNGPQVPVELSFTKMWKQMMETEGLEMGFNIEVADPRPEVSMSKEGMETLRDGMMAWVGTRLYRQFKRTNGRGAKKVQVHVVVSLDGQPPEFTDTVPFFSWPDGEHRQKATDQRENRRIKKFKAKR
jgi:hypothetical protein